MCQYVTIIYIYYIYISVYIHLQNSAYWSSEPRHERTSTSFPLNEVSKGSLLSAAGWTLELSAAME